MTASRIAMITAERGEPSTVIFESFSGMFFTSSLVIQRALLSAFLTRAAVVIDLVDGTKEIRRVKAFEPGREQTPQFPGPDRVNRIATQRNVDGEDHLEVFLIQGQGREEQVNVFDPLLAQLLTTAFDATRSDQGPTLRVTLNSDRKIEAAQLGRVD